MKEIYRAYLQARGILSQYSMPFLRQQRMRSLNLHQLQNQCTNRCAHATCPACPWPRWAWSWCTGSRLGQGGLTASSSYKQPGNSEAWEKYGLKWCMHSQSSPSLKWTVIIIISCPFPEKVRWRCKNSCDHFGEYSKQ